MSDINLTEQERAAQRSGAARPTVGEHLAHTFGSGAVQTETRKTPPTPPARATVGEPSVIRGDEPAKPEFGLDDFLGETEPPIVYSERKVIDERGNSLGRVADVIFEGAESKPTWMVVKPGIFRAPRYVPVRGSYATVTDKLVVPFDQRMISSSPKARGAHVLTARERALLTQHYKLDDA